MRCSITSVMFASLNTYQSLNCLLFCLLSLGGAYVCSYVGSSGGGQSVFSFIMVSVKRSVITLSPQLVSESPVAAVSIWERATTPWQVSLMPNACLQHKPPTIKISNKHTSIEVFVIRIGNNLLDFIIIAIEKVADTAKAGLFWSNGLKKLKCVPKINMNCKLPVHSQL